MTTNTTVAPASGKETIVVNDIRVTTVDRTPKEIVHWRNALRAAESPSNPNRLYLLDLYSEITLDGHLSGIINKRISSVLNKKMFFQDKSGKKVDEMDAIIDSIAFRDLCRLILESQAYGLSGVEFIPGKEFYFVPIPRKHIKIEYGVIAINQSDIQGIPYTDEPNIWVIGDRNNFGYLLQVAPYAIYKKDAMADWANYIQNFGQPVRVIKYDGQNDQIKFELKKILDEAGDSLSLLIPEQANFDMKDGKASNGDGQLQERFKDALNQEMSIIVVGNTETTTNGKTGTGAKSKVHQEQQEMIMQRDIALLQSHLNSAHFIAILTSYGLPVTGGRFVIEVGVDTETLKARMEVDKELAQLVDIPADYFYTTYGLPKPEGSDIIANKKPAPQDPPQDPAPQDPPAPKPPKNKKPTAKDQADDNDPDRPAVIQTPSKSRWKNLKNAFRDFFAPAR